MAVVKKDYRKVAKRIYKAADRARPRNLLVYGRNKKGKSTFCSSAPDVLIIDPEGGADEMKERNPNIFPVTRWEDMDEIWGYLKLGEHDYAWVAVDGTTKLNNMALRYVMRMEEERNLDRRPGIVDRRDYNKSGELMKQMVLNFAALPMGVIFTAQERMTTLDTGDNDEDEESTFFVPDLPAGVRGAINAQVDVIGRIYTTRVEIKGKAKTQRRLHIGPHERYDTGYRSDYELPDLLKYPTVPKLMKLMDEGSQ